MLSEVRSTLRYLSLSTFADIYFSICCYARTKIPRSNWYRKVGYCGTEKIPHCTISYGILVKYKIAVRYFLEARSTEFHSVPYLTPC